MTCIHTNTLLDFCTCDLTTSVASVRNTVCILLNHMVHVFERLIMTVSFHFSYCGCSNFHSLSSTIPNVHPSFSIILESLESLQLSLPMSYHLSTGRLFLLAFMASLLEHNCARRSVKPSAFTASGRGAVGGGTWSQLRCHVLG